MHRFRLLRVGFLMVIAFLGMVILYTFHVPHRLFGTIAPTATPTSSMVQPLITNPNDDLQPTWSPDGTRIAYVGHFEGNPEVYIFDLKSHSNRNISNSRFDDFSPVWSPDGNFIAFLHREERYSNSNTIRIANLATGTVAVFPQKAFVRDTSYLKWQLDSRSLSFYNTQGVYRYDVRAQQSEPIFEQSDNRTYIDFAVFSPDGKMAVVHEQNNFPPYGDTAFFNLSLTTKAQYPLFKKVSAYSWHNFLSWSPDGMQLYYISCFAEYATDAYCSLFSVTNTGQILNQFDLPYDETPYDVTVSPRGEIAYMVFTKETGDYHLFVLTFNPNQSVRELLHITPQVDTLRWSPTQHQIAFKTYAGVYIVDTTSGRFYDPIQGMGYIRDFQWSPNGVYLTANLYLPDFNRGALITVTSDNQHRFLYQSPKDQYLWYAGEVWNPQSTSIALSLPSPYGNSDIDLITDFTSN